MNGAEKNSYSTSEEIVYQLMLGGEKELVIW
jgi:hypothetical protein